MYNEKEIQAAVDLYQRWNFLRIGTVILIYGDAGFLTHRDGYRKTIFLKYRDA